MSRKNKLENKKQRARARAKRKPSKQAQEAEVRQFIESAADDFVEEHSATPEERRAFIRSVIAEGCLPEGLPKLIDGRSSFLRLSPFSFVVEEAGDRRFPGGLVPPWSEFVEVELDSEDVSRRQDLRPDLDGSVLRGLFQNSRFSVILTEVPSGWSDEEGEPIVLSYLSIKSLDRRARHDWREFQRVKNEILGDEVEAVELYPAESRLVDASNQFHLYALPEGMLFPFGMPGRGVSLGGHKSDGSGFARQREHEPGTAPDDALPFEDFQQVIEEDILADTTPGSEDTPGQ